jgi:hypothetical protein
VGKNLGFHIYHPKAIISIWKLSKKNLTWAIRLVECEVPPFEFYFVKTGIKDTIRQMPIHDMAWWAPSLDNVILCFEGPLKKQLVGLVCLGKKTGCRTRFNQCREKVRGEGYLGPWRYSCPWKVNQIQGAHWIGEGRHHNRFPRRFSTHYNNGWELHYKVGCKVTTKGRNII